MKKFKFFLLYLFLGIGLAVAQTKTVTGLVLSQDDNEPVMGASVVVKGNTAIGTVTDMDGNFSLNVPENATVLVVSYVGMTPKEVAVSTQRITVVLESSVALDEVVVTALGITREKKALGYGVTEVKSEELVTSRGGLSSPITALQGKVSGLQIAGSSGNMGGSSKVLIRGNSSISGNNQPLFVIDGVPIEGTDFNSTDTQRGGGGYDYGNLIQDINPDDIESLSVLKGPNASALYGSRAANGVIMITTKKGKKGEGYGISFNSAVGIERVSKLPKLQRLYGGGFGDEFEQVTINGQTYNYPDYATDESWGPKLDGTPILSWYDLYKWEAGGKVGNPTTSPWSAPKNDIKQFFQTGVSFTNNISITNATEFSNVRLSYTNSDLKGYVPNSSLAKNTFNVAASIKSPDKKMEIFTNMTYFNSRAVGRNETGYADNNMMQKFVQWGHREIDMKQSKDLYIMPDGTQATWNRNGWDDPTPAYSNNPYWSRYMNYQNDSRNRIYGNVGLSYQITPDLKFQYKSNLDFWVDKQYERNAVFSQENSKYSEISRQQYELNNEFLLMYNKTFNDFIFSANVGGNMMNRRYENLFGETVGGIAIPLFYNLKNSISTARSTNSLTKRAINSLYGNLTLGWKSTVYLDASLRNDWSSTLPKGNNSYIYPAVTGSFIFSEMINDVSWLSFGKLRIGYALVGNDASPYQIIDIYNQYTNIDAATGTPGYTLSPTLRNKDLKPESTTSFEVGLELNFLNNRIGLEATYYSAETKDQILSLSTSGSTGYTTRVINAGLIANKGFEFALNGAPVRTKDFEWNSIFTLASNKNKVVELTEDTKYYRIVNGPFKVEVGALEGDAYGAIMGTNYVYDNNGNKVVGADGLYLSTSGNENIGTIFPDFNGGWNNTFRYKNFELGVLLDFSRGGSYFSTSYMWGMYSGMLEETAANNVRETGLVLEGVKQDGSKNDINVSMEDYGSSLYSGPAAQSIMKSDYIKLREINIGYTIPLKKSYFVKGLRLSAYGRNLAVWGPDVKHFDPESMVTGSGNIQGIEGAALPSIATFGFNLGLKF